MNDSGDSGTWKVPREAVHLEKKIRHFDEPGHAHFLTFSCYHRLPLLSRDRTRRWLIEAIDAARTKHGFDLWAWVIMPEHVHLLIWPKQSTDRVAGILADIKRPVGQKAISWLETNSPAFLAKLTVKNRNRLYRRFWQAGPGQDRNVFDPAAAHDIVDYIHGNPVQRGLAASPEEWCWSSAAEWSGRSGILLGVDKSMPRITKFAT
jgi:putative transposase